MKELRAHLGEHLGEQFFEFIKAWEPLVNGYVVKDPIDDLGFDGLFKESLKTMEELYPGFRNSKFFNILTPNSYDKELLIL